MAWTNLPTNFKNLVWSGLKKYRQYTNQDNTVSFEDVTEYDDTEGTQMSASQLNQMTGAINKLMTGIASDFSSSINYAVGDYCMYNDQLYRFTTAHPAGSWNSSHVTAVSKITNELTEKLSDAPSDNKEYVRKNGDWAEASGGGGGGGGTWGSITGTLSDQTDLQNALDGKSNTGHDHDDRYYTESEIDGLTQIINYELAGKSNTGHTHDDRYYTESEVDTKLSGKQNTLTFDSTPTASSTNPVMSNGIKTYVDNKVLYFSSGDSNAMTVNAATNAQIGRIPASGTDSRITTDTVVLSIVFANPSAITSNVSWTSYAGYVTFSGTCTTATSANVILGTKGN